MGLIPLSFLTKRKKEKQLKQEHPMQEEWEEMREQPESIMPEHLPISPYTGMPYDPRLIGKEYR